MNTKEIKPFNTYYDFIEERNMWLCSIGKGGFLIVCREVGETKSLAFQSALKSFLILKKENPSIIENILNGYNKLKRNHKGLNKEINPDLINKKPMKTLLTTTLILILLCSCSNNNSIKKEKVITKKVEVKKYNDLSEQLLYENFDIYMKFQNQILMYNDLFIKYNSKFMYYSNKNDIVNMQIYIDSLKIAHYKSIAIKELLYSEISNK